jgi:transposase
MKSNPEVIELDEADLESKLDQIEAVMGVDMAQPFRQLLRWYAVLLGLLREKKLSIRRLLRMLFGASTERTSSVLSPSGESSGQVEDTSAENAADHPASPQETPSTAEDQGTSGNSTSDGRAPRRRRPGHGRIPASNFTGCAIVMVTHPWLRPGDACPQCGSGTLYRQQRWSPVVRLKGHPPVTGQVYQLERLRCQDCGKTFTAELPEEAGRDKYDPTVASVVATLRYGEGMPWKRLQRMQQFAGIPLPASDQWELVRDAAERGPRQAYQHLVWLAAQGELMHNDDTTMRVLELTGKTKRQEPLLEEDPERRGVFTTGVVSLAEGKPTIALFFTGPHHAGENLRTLLEGRLAELPPPIHMCDGLSRNMPHDLRVIVANCLVHARRKFVDVVEDFPAEVEYLLDCLKKVYQIDAEAKRQKVSPDERLRLHQEQSGPVMNELHDWLKTRFDEKRVEPNSSLGGAISYMLNHWEELTLFLRVPGAPLDNNLCERVLKMAIRHRNNSLFYRTMRGAAVGDLYMSLIHTCYLSGVSPVDYLTELQRNHERVLAAPGDWMPWNYRRQLAAAESDPTTGRGPPGDGALRTSDSPCN